MNNYNLNKHEAFEILKNYSVIPILVEDVMYQDGELKSNYSFQDFSELLVKNNDEIIEEICDAMKTRGEAYRGLPDNTPEERINLKNKIKGDIFEIFVMFTLQYFQTDSGVGIEQTTYRQIPDEYDKGLDFVGIHYATGKRVFGQVKYRNPFSKPEHQIAFTCTEKNKLIGEATERDFYKKDDLLMFVCNNPISDAMHYELKNVIGWTGTHPDDTHKYIKIIDENYFEKMIDYNNKRFWETFADICKITEA